MDKPILHLEPHCSPCYNFLKGNSEQKVTVWLVPISIREDGARSRIAWACSMGKDCECTACIYARGEV